MRLVMDLADRVLALDFGVPIATGTPGGDPAGPQGDRGLPGWWRMTQTLEATATLASRLLEHARDRAGEVAIREKHRGVWREWTWAEYAKRVADVAAGLRSLGVGPGSRVAVHAENRPEWVIADLAAQGLGACTVGVYPTSPAAEVEYLLGPLRGGGADRRGRGAARQGARRPRPAAAAAPRGGDGPARAALRRPAGRAHVRGAGGAWRHAGRDAGVRGVGRGARPGRHRGPRLHLRHDRPAEGRDDLARQPGRGRRARSSRCSARGAATRC